MSSTSHTDVIQPSRSPSLSVIRFSYSPTMATSSTLVLFLSLLLLVGPGLAAREAGYRSHEVQRNASLSLAGGAKAKNPFGAINNLGSPVGRFAPRQEECPGEGKSRLLLLNP